MSTQPQTRPKPRPAVQNDRARVPMSLIRCMVRQIAAQFDPQRIILFGSYAYGEPGPDSDVDVLVVMQASNETNQAVRIRLAVEHPFPLDLIVRTPANLRRRLELGDAFLGDAVSRGITLYEKADCRMGSKGRSRPGGSGKTDRSKAAAE